MTESISERYESYRNPSWSTVLARRVHEFFRDVLEVLNDNHFEEIWDYTSYGSGGTGEFYAGLVLFARDGLARARIAQEHPTLQMHEWLHNLDVEDFAQTFYEELLKGDTGDHSLSHRAAAVARRVETGEMEDFDHGVATRLVRARKDWVELDDEAFAAEWDRMTELWRWEERSRTVSFDV